ncbi:MAG: 4-hydroxybenzoate octaprenyltransferase [Rhodobacteraceae bacterium]|nr:4-hydroxybenzoate octaprenyltransferase [Paracoccaceae bacterium]
MGDTMRTSRAEGRVADAAADNWVDRFAPPAARPYLRLSRADRPIGTWLLLIPCWWGLALAALAGPSGFRPFDLWIAAGCGIGALLMRGAGCTWNDLTDREIDAAVARTRSRPLPSRQVAPRQALVWMVAQALAAFLILLSFPPLAIALGIASLALVAIYPFAKRFTWWPQVFLGLAFNWGVLVGWAAHAGTLRAAPILLYGAGIAWTLFYDTIYAHQDREDDALIGVKSTARLFGADTGRWLAGFHIAATGLAALAILACRPAPLPAALALAGLIGFAAHLLRQLRRLAIDDPATCLAIFHSNRDAGLLLAAGLALAAAAATTGSP